MRWLTTLCTALMLVTACTQATGVPEDPDLDFAAELVRPGSGDVPELNAVGGPGRIAIHGAIGTPYPCFDIQGRARRVGSATIALEVSAERRDAPCNAVVATHAYAASLQAVPRGKYDIHILHVQGGEPRLVHEESVTVW